MDRVRLEAFSDGVMAVAITLLALNLVLPGPGHGALLEQLKHSWPFFMAYLVSFFTIGNIWVNHHALIRTVAVVDRTLLFLNLLLLFFVVAIPFATATMAEYLGTGGTDSKVAMAIYALVFLGMGLSFSGMVEWTLHEGRRHQEVPKEAIRVIRWRIFFGTSVYILAVVMALISPPIALAIIGLIAVYYVFEHA